MIIKNERNDLNIFHILARGGLLKNEHFQQYSSHLLYEKNKNNWLPIHLSKNQKTAELFLKNMYFQNSKNKNDIFYYGLLNNSESTQTQYGDNLKNVFLNYQFNIEQSEEGSLPPNDLERTNLSLFWILNFDWINESYDKSIIFQKAIENSNSYFFFAFLNNPYFPIIKSFISKDIIIGKNFFISQNVYQIYQILKQNFNLKLEMQSYLFKNKKVLINEYFFENLEGA